MLIQSGVAGMSSAEEHFYMKTWTESKAARVFLAEGNASAKGQGWKEQGRLKESRENLWSWSILSERQILCRSGLC